MSRAHYNDAKDAATQELKITEELMANRDILSWHGIPQSVATILLKQSYAGTMCAVRGNEEDRPASQLYVRTVTGQKPRPFFPKPPTVKAKTGNRFPTNGVISEDILLSKSVLGDDKKWHIKERGPNDIPISAIKAQHEITLQEVLDKITHNECALLSTPQELNSGIIKFKNKSADIAEDAKDIEFSITIPPEKMSLVKFANTNEAKTMLTPFNIIASNYFSLSYKKPSENKFSPVMIYGFPEKNNDGFLPITGDIDLLIIGFNTDLVMQVSKSMPSATQPINTFIDNNIAEMIQKRVDLELALFKIKHPNASQQQIMDEVKRIIREIDNNSIAQQGMISPLESLMIDQSNKIFKNTLGQLFQHGAESRNPGKQEIIGKSIFFMDGKIHSTNGPQQTAELLSMALDKKLHFEINPRWDRKYFSQVIKKQMDIANRGEGPPLPLKLRFQTEPIEQTLEKIKQKYRNLQEKDIKQKTPTSKLKTQSSQIFKNPAPVSAQSKKSTADILAIISKKYSKFQGENATNNTSQENKKTNNPYLTFFPENESPQNKNEDSNANNALKVTDDFKDKKPPDMGMKH